MTTNFNNLTEIQKERAINEFNYYQHNIFVETISFEEIRELLETTDYGNNYDTEY